MLSKFSTACEPFDYLDTSLIDFCVLCCVLFWLPLNLFLPFPLGQNVFSVLMLSQQYLGSQRVAMLARPILFMLTLVGK